MSKKVDNGKVKTKEDIDVKLKSLPNFDFICQYGEKEIWLNPTAYKDDWSIGTSFKLKGSYISTL